MVRLTTSVLAASLLAIPALATSSQQYKRHAAESDLYGRDLIDIEDNVIARELLDDLFGREFFDDEDFDLREFDEDMEAREPGFGALFKAGKTLVTKGAKLVNKGVKNNHHGHHHHHHHKAEALSEYIPQQSNYPSQNQRREFGEEFNFREFDEDLEAREPGFGALFKAGKTLVTKGAKLVNKGVKQQHRGHHHHHHHKAQALSEYIPQQNNDPSQLQQREFDEMFERDFDMEDILEREYFDELD